MPEGRTRRGRLPDAPRWSIRIDGCRHRAAVPVWFRTLRCRPRQPGAQSGHQGECEHQAARSTRAHGRCTAARAVARRRSDLHLRGRHRRTASHRRRAPCVDGVGRVRRARPGRRPGLKASLVPGRANHRIRLHPRAIREHDGAGIERFDATHVLVPRSRMASITATYTIAGATPTGVAGEDALRGTGSPNWVTSPIADFSRRGRATGSEATRGRAELRSVPGLPPACKVMLAGGNIKTCRPGDQVVRLHWERQVKTSTLCPRKGAGFRYPAEWIRVPAKPSRPGQSGIKRGVFIAGRDDDLADLELAGARRHLPTRFPDRSGPPSPGPVDPVRSSSRDAITW